MNKLMSRLVAALLAGLATGAVFADAGDTSFRFELGLAGSSGLSDLKTKIQAANPNIAVSTLVPVGLALGGYKPIGDGWAVGGRIGPMIAGGGAIDFRIVPVGIDARRFFPMGDANRAYVRAGIEKAFASGALRNSSTGAMLGVGVEGAHWGIDLGFSGAAVVVPGNGIVADQQVKPYKGTLTGSYVF